MIGKFLNFLSTGLKCPCDTLPESEVILTDKGGYSKYALVNRNSMWYTTMEFGKYDYDSGEGTIKKFKITKGNKVLIDIGPLKGLLVQKIKYGGQEKAAINFPSIPGSPGCGNQGDTLGSS